MTLIILGQYYTDKLTDFVGVATAQCFYLDGTHSVHLENSKDSRWVGFERLEKLSDELLNNPSFYKP